MPVEVDLHGEISDRLSSPRIQKFSKVVLQGRIGHRQLGKHTGLLIIGSRVQMRKAFDMVLWKRGAKRTWTSKTW